MARKTQGIRQSIALGLTLLLAGCGVAGGLTPAANTARATDFASMAKVDGRAQVTIHFANRAQLDQLAVSGVDLFENVDLEHGTVGASLTAQTKALLDKLGVKYAVKQGVSAKGFPQGYGSVEAVHAEMRALAEAHPQIATIVEFGKSIENRPMLALRLTTKPNAGLPAVRLQGGTHARELVPVELMRLIAKHLAGGAGKDATVTRLLDTREVWIVPVANPDGRVRVEGGSAMWRKNARPLGMGANGVDINRNADEHWSQGNGMKWADDYHGESAFSEPETQALRDLSLKVNFKASIDVHCYAGMLLWPPGYSTEFTADEPTFKTIGEKMAKPLGYRAGTIARTIYKTFGDFATWEYAKCHTLAFAAELDDGEFGPGFGQVEKDWKGWKDNFLYLIDAAGNPGAKHATEGRLLGFNGL